MTSKIIDRADSAAEWYADKPIIRALANLIPCNVGSAADIWLVEHVTKIKQRRAKAFFDELARGDTVLTQELIESEDFIHSFICTARAALNTKHDEKIRMFARLIINGIRYDNSIPSDDHEEIIGIIDELYHREWQALLVFQRNLENQPLCDNGLQRIQSFWKAFSEELYSSLGVPVSETSSFMIRIARTGLFHEITGSYFGYGGGLGMTTPRFQRVRKLIETHIDENRSA
jgi:hypothetical protein